MMVGRDLGRSSVYSKHFSITRRTKRWSIGSTCGNCLTIKRHEHNIRTRVLHISLNEMSMLLGRFKLNLRIYFYFG